MITVLLADYNNDNLEQIKNLIDWKKNGFQIVGVALDGEELLKKNKMYDPQLVIMETDLPVISGLEAAQEIMNYNNDTEVIFLSENESFEYARKAIEIGVSDYITKRELNEALLQEKVLEIKNKFFQNHALPTTENFRDRNYRYHQSYNVVLVEQDYFLPVFTEAFYIKNDEIEDDIIKNICYRSLTNVMLVLKVDTYRHLVLTVADETSGNMGEFCYRLKNKLYKETTHDFSVFILSEHTRMEESITQYHLIKKLINQKYFCNISSVMNFAYLNEKKAVIAELDTERFEKAVECVDYDTIYYEMDQRFIEIINTMDYDAFALIARQFLDILKKKDKELIDIKTGEIFRVYEKGDEENWYLVTDAIQWLKRKYIQMGQIILNNQKQDYSNEVLLTCKYVYEHYKEPDLCIADIIEYVNVSETRLRTIFKEEVGVNILQFITDYRVKKAKELLCNRKMKVSDIHMQIGYTTSQYFSRVFKKLNCMTPIEYKKLRYKAD